MSDNIIGHLFWYNRWHVSAADIISGQATVSDAQDGVVVQPFWYSKGGIWRVTAADIINEHAGTEQVADFHAVDNDQAVEDE